MDMDPVNTLVVGFGLTMGTALMLEMVLFLTFSRLYYRLSRPRTDLPPISWMPLEESRGTHRTVTWRGDGQALFLRRRLAMGRRSYAFGRMERGPAGGIQVYWSPFPLLSYLVALPCLAVVLWLVYAPQLSAAMTGMLIVGVLVMMLLATTLNMYFSRQTFKALLTDLEDGLS